MLQKNFKNLILLVGQPYNFKFLVLAPRVNCMHFFVFAVFHILQAISCRFVHHYKYLVLIYLHLFMILSTDITGMLILRISIVDMFICHISGVGHIEGVLFVLNCALKTSLRLIIQTVAQQIDLFCGALPSGLTC